MATAVSPSLAPLPPTAISADALVALRADMMREFFGFACEKICTQLGITIRNCHVILHPARLKLRACI